MDICLLIKCIVFSLLLQRNINYVSSSLMCESNDNPIGYTFPEGDITLDYKKEALEIYCILNNSTYIKEDYPSKHLYFEREKVKLTDNVEIINSTTIRLRKENPEGPASTYSCLYHNRVVCLNRVIIGEKPSFVTDFDCESYNLQNLSCKWSSENNNVTTNYQITYTIDNDGISYNCNETELNKCTVSTYHPAGTYYNFRINATNSLGETIRNVSINNFKSVRSGPPENLTAIGFDEHSIKIKWKTPGIMRVLPLNYRIFLKCNFGIDDWKLSFHSISIKSEENVYNITNLYPNQNCTIRVSLKCNHSEDNMWSQNSSITYKTESTVPELPPKINIGSFKIIKIFPNMSNVYIYWQEIPKEMENGDNFHYKVKIIDTSSDYSKVENVKKYVKFENLYNNKNYIVIIWSENSKGISENNSIMTIPAHTERPSEVESLTNIVYNNGTFELKFNSPEQAMSIKNYTIFWCKNLNPSAHRCEGYLNWTEIPSNITSFKVPVKEIEGTTWQFAVSVNSDNASSGMVWVSCILHEGKETIENFELITDTINSTSISVRWKLKCFSEYFNLGYKYVLSYCSFDKPLNRCKEKIQNKTTSELNTEIFNNLLPNTVYKLMLIIVSKDLKVNEKHLFAKTSEGVPSKPDGLKIIFVTNSSIKITWKRPNITNGNISHYILKLNKDIINVSSINVLEHTFHNLISYYNYTISVNACIQLCSESSDNITTLTKIGAPGQVNKLRILTQKESFIIIDWNKPELPRGRIDYYEVQIRANDGFQSENVTGSTKYSRNCDLNTFYVSVRAVNIDGDNFYYGPWSLDLECSCVENSIVLIIIIVISFIIGITILLLGLRLYTKCVILKAEDIILPGIWTSSKNLENQQAFSPMIDNVKDIKMNETSLTSNDLSSVCSDKSVTSDELNNLCTENTSTILCFESTTNNLFSESTINSLSSGKSMNTDEIRNLYPEESEESETNKLGLNLTPNELEIKEKLKSIVSIEEKSYLKITDVSKLAPKKEGNSGYYVMVGEH